MERSDTEPPKFIYLFVFINIFFVIVYKYEMSIGNIIKSTAVNYSVHDISQMLPKFNDTFRYFIGH